MGSKAVTLSRNIIMTAWLFNTPLSSLQLASTPFFLLQQGQGQGGSVAIMLSLKRLCSHRWWQHPHHSGKGHRFHGICTSAATKWYQSDITPFPSNLGDQQIGSNWLLWARNITMAPDSLLRAAGAWWNSADTAWGTGACHLPGNFSFEKKNNLTMYVYLWQFLIY